MTQTAPTVTSLNRPRSVASVKSAVQRELIGWALFRPRHAWSYCSVVPPGKLNITPIATHSSPDLLTGAAGFVTCPILVRRGDGLRITPGRTSRVPCPVRSPAGPVRDRRRTGPAGLPRTWVEANTYGAASGPRLGPRPALKAAGGRAQAVWEHVSGGGVRRPQGTSSAPPSSSLARVFA